MFSRPVNKAHRIFWAVWVVNQEMKDWLSTIGTAYPGVPSRLPTGLEIKAALREICQYDVTIQSSGMNAAWHAEIRSTKGSNEPDRAMLSITTYSGDEHPQELYFSHADEPIVVDVLTQLSRWCGPLVAIPDTGTAPLVIFPPNVIPAAHG